MKEQNFTTTLLADQTPHEVYTAINNVSGWWHGEINGPTEAVNDEFSYRMKEMHYSKQLITELIPDKKVEWLVTDSKLSFTQKPDEWTGTKIRFEIAEVNGKTQLTFTHEGLTPAFECYGGCSNGWTMLIQESLVSLLNTGIGKEVF